VSADEPFPADRCAANEAAGTITYLSSYDFAAAASIVDVLVADSKGYYAELCLDVEIKPSFSTENYPLIAANDAQFSSGGSFSEMVDFAGANDAGYVALAVEGRTGIDALITKDGAVPTLIDVAGAKIGVKGAITPSVKAMLAKQGMVEGVDYETVNLDGYDPLAHRSARHRRLPRVQEQRARAARSGGGALQAVRPERLRHPRQLRRAVHQPHVPGGAPHRGAGLHASHDARPP
jgi:NitT/TauT family transport system substrate-binding protein